MSYDKFNHIKGQMQLTNSKIVNFSVEIYDEYAITRIEDISAMRKLVTAEQRHGNNNIKYNDQLKAIMERFPGKNRDEITKIIGKQLNKHKINI